MFWIVYSSVLALLIVAAIIMEKNDNNWAVIPGLSAFVLGLTGLFMGFSMPTVYTVSENGEIKERKYCLPVRYSLHDGTYLHMHLDSTYVINEAKLPLCLEAVHYVRRDYMEECVLFSYRDTVDTPVLRFISKNVSAFVEAPSFMEASENERVRRIIVVSLERQHFSPVETCRYLSEPDDSYPVMDNFANL